MQDMHTHERFLQLTVQTYTVPKAGDK